MQPKVMQRPVLPATGFHASVCIINAHNKRHFPGEVNHTSHIHAHTITIACTARLFTVVHTLGQKAKNFMCGIDGWAYG